jgi:hypothetical protein
MDLISLYMTNISSVKAKAKPEKWEVLVYNIKAMQRAALRTAADSRKPLAGGLNETGYIQNNCFHLSNFILD